MLVVAAVDCCLVGWKEDRARKAARKLERKGAKGARANNYKSSEIVVERFSDVISQSQSSSYNQA